MINPITGYITNEEYMNSIYYGSFVIPCALSGNASGYVDELITIATSLIVNYLGYDMLYQQRKDNFRGGNKSVHICKFFPIDEVSGVVMTYKQAKNNLFGTGYYSQASNIVSGTVSNVYITDPDNGIIEIDGCFLNNYRYFMTYYAGRTTIPEDIKYCVKVLVTQLSIMNDIGALANIDVSFDSYKVDSLSFNFGSSRYIKNITIKDLNDVKGLPMTVFPILNKYRYSSMT